MSTQHRSMFRVVTSIPCWRPCLWAGMAPAARRGRGKPNTAKFPWGTFTLNSRIAAKVAAHQPINAIISFQALGVPFAVPEMNAGMKREAAAMKAKYGVTINYKVVGPVNTDPNAQISQIQTLISSGQVDCLAIEPVTPNAFADIFSVASRPACRSSRSIPMLPRRTASATMASTSGGRQDCRQVHRKLAGPAHITPRPRRCSQATPRRPGRRAG